MSVSMIIRFTVQNTIIIKFMKRIRNAEKIFFVTQNYLKFKIYIIKYMFDVSKPHPGRPADIGL